MHLGGVARVGAAEGDATIGGGGANIEKNSSSLSFIDLENYLLEAKTYILSPNVFIIIFSY